MKKVLVLVIVAVIGLLVFSNIELIESNGISDDEQAFIDAVESIGDVSESSYQAIKNAYSLLNQIDYTRQGSMIQEVKSSFMSLKLANVQLFNILANKVPDTFEPYLSYKELNWTNPDIDENIPVEVLNNFYNDKNSREALDKAEEVYDWLFDNMYDLYLFTFSDKCDEEMYLKVLHYSYAVEYWEEKMSGKKNNSASKTQDDGWAKDYLEEQLGTSDPDEVERIGKLYQIKGDDFYDRYGYYPEG